jgi:hypothetical protein
LFSVCKKLIPSSLLSRVPTLGSVLEVDTDPSLLEAILQLKEGDPE